MTTCRSSRLPIKPIVLAAALCAGITTASFASIIGTTDGRGELTTIGPQIGLSPSEIDLIHRATGAIRCPDGAYGTAQLVFNLSTILTAAHNLIDSDGFSRGNLRDCVFVSQAPGGNREPIPIKVEEGSLFLGTLQRTEGREAFDYAVVRLSRDVRGARWYELPASLPETAGPDVGDRPAIQVAAWQPSRGPDDATPIVQDCLIRHYRPQAVLTDCDVEGAASGGATLVRADSGQLHLAGIVVTANEDTKDFEPYDLAEGVFSYTVAFRGRMLDAARAVAQRQPLPRGNAWDFD